MTKTFLLGELNNENNIGNRNKNEKTDSNSS